MKTPGKVGVEVALPAVKRVKKVILATHDRGLEVVVWAETEMMVTGCILLISGTMWESRIWKSSSANSVL